MSAPTERHLTDEIAQYEGAIRELVRRRDELLQEGDRAEKQLTALLKPGTEDSMGDQSEHKYISRTLKLLLRQTDTLENEVAFFDTTNKRLQDEITYLASAHAAQKREIQEELMQEREKANKYADEASTLEEKLAEVNKAIEDLTRYAAEKRREREGIERALREFDGLVKECRFTYQTRPREGLLESLAEEATEIRAELVRLLVTAYEQPLAFLENGNGEQYKTLLARLNRKKNQIALARQQRRTSSGRGTD
ncbi:hypothetical protein GMRT_15195 [Giardia muris]|uniref:Uncharacterized protein n=1 Tax=Giardia muris TaxID=5742 RepID=A0A4Z1T6M4_GIAMU|nr:hypothetical protein GMRT_15195 [Giardia muris]|eukprot:TNJ28131.1 hypothetical protein GMRT_15195 [Giardia muris]